MKSVNIGLIGFGTIGSGLYSLLEKNRDLIKERTGLDIRIKTVCDIRINEIRGKLSNVIITDNWKEIINDEEIDTVVELIGGIEPAKTIIIEALNKGKNAVTANKKMLAEEGSAIFETAVKMKAGLGFEASVCGGIPCVQALREGLVGNRINAVMGILNGTTNYILTKMNELGLPFSAALKDAQKKGFAEADPTFDIEGYDAGHKIAILSQLAFNRRIDYKKIPVEGITKISGLDIQYAREMGYIIKLLGISKLIDDMVDIRVHPTMLPVGHPLASVRNEFNAVMFSGDMTGPVTFYGKGAGGSPTASAVISDIVRLKKKGGEARDLAVSGITEYLTCERRKSMYYIRLSTQDRPGILSRISGVLAEHDISIASVIQKAKNTRYVPMVIMTHEAAESGMLQSIETINNYDFIDGKVTMIRVENSDMIGENNE